MMKKVYERRFVRRILLLAIVLIAISIPGGALAQPEIRSEIAPTGKLRVAMNAATPVLLQRTPDGKITGGVALEVGKFIAEKLGVPFELVPYASAVAYQQSFGKGEWDIGFGGKSSAGVREADFILDVLLTDYLFLAAPGRQFADAAQVDRPGVKIGVGTDTSSDRFLSRTVKSADSFVLALVRLRRYAPARWMSGREDAVLSNRLPKGFPERKLCPEPSPVIRRW